MNRRVKLGIVGCGFAGTQTMYAPILRLLENTEVTALMDPDPRALNFMTEHYGAFDCYTDYETFLAQADVEAVLIATPVFLHEAQAIQALEAGKHVLCEKPMAATIEACDRMAEAAERCQRMLTVGFVRRLDKNIEAVTGLLREGRIGKLFHIYAETSWCHDLSPLGPNWRQSIRTQGGVLQDNGCHMIDLARLWAGEIDTVSGTIGLLRDDWEVETWAVATLRHCNGVVTTLKTSNMSQCPMVESFLLEGTTGTLDVRFGPAAKYSSPEPFEVHLWEQGKRRTELTRFNHGNLDTELRQHGMYKRQIDDFCASVRDHAAPSVSALDGRKAVEVINAVYLSATTGGIISLPLASSAGFEAAFRKPAVN